MDAGFPDANCDRRSIRSELGTGSARVHAWGLCDHPSEEPTACASAAPDPVPGDGTLADMSPGLRVLRFVFVGTLVTFGAACQPFDELEDRLSGASRRPSEPDRSAETPEPSGDPDDSPAPPAE